MTNAMEKIRYEFIEAANNYFDAQRKAIVQQLRVSGSMPLNVLSSTGKQAAFSLERRNCVFLKNEKDGSLAIYKKKPNYLFLTLSLGSIGQGFDTITRRLNL